MNGKTTFFKYDYICRRFTSKTNQDEEPNLEENILTDNLSSLPFNDAFNLSLEEPASSEEDSEATKYLPFLPKGRKFLHININGIRNKFEEIEHLLVNEKDIVVFAITESKLNSVSDHPNMYNVNGYNTIRLDRPNSKRGGGIMVYVNSNFSYKTTNYLLKITHQ